MGVGGGGYDYEGIGYLLGYMLLGFILLGYILLRKKTRVIWGYHNMEGSTQVLGYIPGYIP